MSAATGARASAGPRRWKTGRSTASTVCGTRRSRSRRTGSTKTPQPSTAEPLDLLGGSRATLASGHPTPASCFRTERAAAAGRVRGPTGAGGVRPLGYGRDDAFVDMRDAGALPALLRIEAHGPVVALGDHEVGPDPALSAQLVLEAVEEHGGGAGPEMIGMDVDEGELTETGRIRQPVEHLGGLTRRAHPAEAQALTVSGPVDDEGLDRCLLVGEVRRPGGV